MYSPALHRLLIQAQTEDLHRAAQTFNRPLAATRAGDIRRPKATPLSAYLKRAAERVFYHAAATSQEAAANRVLEIVGPGTAATRSQRT